jgi:GH15 family glucan-1,4-alpha-glucosidase
LRTTGDYWKAWLGANERSFADLSAEQVSLFNRSLMFVRAHVDARGGVLASLDSDMLNYGLDTYSYVWPRDAAYATLALDAAGDTNVAKRFFEFCRELFGGEGYLLHKYRPDGSLGSSWHPWILDGRFQLPIQEDETAIVLWAFREHFRRSRDLEFLEAMYESLVEKPAEFMLQYRDPFTKLPQPSYELWEEQRGVSTYTSACVYGALSAAADLASVLGKVQEAQRYQIGAREIAEGIMAHLWDEKRHVFYKLFSGDEERVYDTAIDISSPYGIFAFGVLPQNDPRLAAAFSASVRALSHGIPIGGVARYQGDQYGRVDTESAGNPWVNTTLWYAEFLIANAATESDFSKIRDIFSWVEARASRSGALSEQFDPRTGAGVSASPLVWSHVGYVLAVLKYLERKKALQSQR